ALIVSGAFFVKFSGSQGAQLIGWALIPCGGVVFLLGVMSFRKNKRHIAEMGRRAAESEGKGKEAR
ncbi:MAG: hypothetical protein JXR94_06040, partial [Candidatus Hydrogenedentes bacterium]|nr:hypothetical protein [Candidatus Hydrogenedentota bacterium]